MTVHRVVIKRRDYRGNYIVESGPWHPTTGDAERWANILRHLGYTTQVEHMRGEVVGTSAGGDSDLRDALASMA